MMNDRPRSPRMPFPTRLLYLLLYLLTMTVTGSLIVVCLAGARFLILRFLQVDCGP
jgi:hypothetical protein